MSRFSTRKGRGGLRYATYGSVAIVSILIGILIASGLNLPTESVARQSPNIVETGLHPVVNRDGVQESPFVAVVEQVQDAVVNISARTRQEPRSFWHRGGNGQGTSSGSGFFFREDGYILTNNHVVENAIRVTVRTASGFEYEAVVVGTDPETDLAVLKVEPQEQITTISFGNSDHLKVGDWAIAIGNPFPQQGLDRTVTVGVISAIGRSQLNFGRETPYYQYYIQTDASINPGNSGGPLLNLRGECIGVNSAISSPSGGSVGIGFAIPINLARAITPDLIATGHVSRGWLGVWLNNVSEREAKRQGLDAVKGVRIDSVFSGSPAENAGIKKGDIIVGFGDQDVVNAGQLSVLVSTMKVGEAVPIELVRNGSHKSLRADIGDRDWYVSGRNRRVERELPRGYLWLGMELVDFTEELADKLGVEHVPGLYVRNVERGSSADRASITRGTIIILVDKHAVASLKEFTPLAGKLKSAGKRIPLIVQQPDGTPARRVLRP